MGAARRHPGLDPNASHVLASVGQSCRATAVDRPWLAYAGGDRYGGAKLLLVNNPAVVLNPSHPSAMYGNELQLGLYDTKTGHATWNMCASQGFIPGVPAVRTSDHKFAAPQVVETKGPTPRSLAIIHGDLDHGVGRGRQAATPLFGVKSEYLACFDRGGAPNWGGTAFDKTGTLYALAATDDNHFAIATSADGTHFGAPVTIPAGGPLWFLWISGSQTGSGALVTWAESTSCPAAAAPVPGVDFYAAHVSPTGEISDKSLVAGGVVRPCGDYHGSSLGPDGKAYLVVTSSPAACNPTPGSHPLTAYIQSGGPTG